MLIVQISIIHRVPRSYQLINLIEKDTLASGGGGTIARERRCT